MSNECCFQTIQIEINESRCIIPLILKSKESWLCEYYLQEYNCPIIKRMKKQKDL